MSVQTETNLVIEDRDNNVTVKRGHTSGSNTITHAIARIAENLTEGVGVNHALNLPKNVSWSEYDDSSYTGYSDATTFRIVRENGRVRVGLDIGNNLISPERFRQLCRERGQREKRINAKYA